jgi:hypothetical protein
MKGGIMFTHSPRPGDILYVNRGFYLHYGLYAGDGRVIHFAPLSGNEINAENAVIHEITLDAFLKGGELNIDKKAKASYPREEIVRRARAQIGAKGYNLVFNNCEHFARWCKSGISESKQVENAIKMAVEVVDVISDIFDQQGR